MSNPFMTESDFPIKFGGITFYPHENGGWYSGLIDVMADGMSAIDYAEADDDGAWACPRWDLSTEDGLRAFRLYVLMEVVPRREQLEVA